MIWVQSFAYKVLPNWRKWELFLGKWIVYMSVEIHESLHARDCSALKRV